MHAVDAAPRLPAHRQMHVMKKNGLERPAGDAHDGKDAAHGTEAPGTGPWLAGHRHGEVAGGRGRGNGQDSRRRCSTGFRSRHARRRYTAAAMFTPRSIKHCRACGAPAHYACRPTTTASAPPARLRHHPLREPAERGRHRAVLARQVLPCRRTSSRGTASGRRRPASWSSAKPPRDGLCARRIEEARREGRDAGAVHAAERGARRPGAFLLTARGCSTPALRSRRDHRGACSARTRFPLGRDRPSAPCAPCAGAISPPGSITACTAPISPEPDRMNLNDPRP